MAKTYGTRSNDYPLTGTLANDILFGRQGDDLLLGLLGRDLLYGEEGNDTLDGGQGADTLLGGQGDDRYLVDQTSDVVREGANEGQDTVRASINYSLPDAVENLELAGASARRASGNALANTLTGNAQDNTLQGGAGADTLYGGAGDDKYYVDRQSDLVIETSAGGGIDTVYSTALAYTLPAHVEKGRILSESTAGLTGNSLNNVLLAGDGNNRLDGAGGTDTADYRHANAGVRLSLAVTAAQATGGSGADTLLHIENLSGSAFDDRLSGNAGANVLTGGDGADTLLGADGADRLNGGEGADVLDGGSGRDRLQGDAGDDTLDGGSGADTMTGGTGDDVYTVDDAGDLVLELTGGGSDAVYSALASYTLGDTVENGVVLGSSAAALTGNGLDNVLASSGGDQISLYGAGGDDTLTGGLGADTLDGGSGSDYMSGGAGDDVYYVDDAGDTLTELSGGGTDTVYSWLSSYTLGSEFENGVLCSASAGDLTGNALNNVLSGSGGAATLDGANGDDTLLGGASADTLDGGSGADTMIGGADDDVYYVDDAGDRVIEAAGGGTDSVHSRLASYTLENEIENGLVSSGGTAILIGNALNNWLSVGTGAASLDGANGNDTLAGGTGADTLDGGNGADTMTGGAGDDVYYLDDAGDLIMELTGGGTDTVYSARSSYTLGSEIENGVVASSSTADLTGNGLDNVLRSGAGDNVLDGDAGSDTASYETASAGVTVALAGEVALRYLFNDAAATSYSNPGADAAFALPAELGNAAWTARDGGLNGSGLVGQGAAGKAVAATGWNDGDGNAFQFTLTVASGYQLDLSEISFWEQGSNGGQGNGPSSWALTLNGVSLDSGSATRGTPGGTHSISDTALSALSANTQGLTGTLQFSLSATGSALAGSTWRIDNFTLSGSLSAVAPVAQNTVGAGNDQLLNIEHLTGSDFADSLTGDVSANVLSGLDGDDVLKGLGGADTLLGGNGDDTLDGGAGVDSLTGGDGADTFRFSALQLGSTAADVITDFESSGGDRLALDNGWFTALADGALGGSAFESVSSGGATASSTRIVYDTALGKLYYDADGSGTGYAAVWFATLTGAPTLTATDFLVV